jgi:hypothetical protein
MVELEAHVAQPHLKYKIVIGPERRMAFRYEYPDDASGFSGVVSGNGLVDELVLRSIQAVLTDQSFNDLPQMLSYGSVAQGAGTYRLRVEQSGKIHEVQMLEGGTRAEPEWMRFFLVWEKLIDACPAQPRTLVPISAAQSEPNKLLQATRETRAPEQ